MCQFISVLINVQVTDYRSTFKLALNKLTSVIYMNRIRVYCLGLGQELNGAFDWERLARDKG